MVLHRVATVEQGPLDSVLTDARGRFRFRFRSDTSALYLLSARHQGIEYFSAPVGRGPARADTAIEIVVADTSADAPIGLAARHLVVTRPGEDGTRSVFDLLMLQNASRRTRAASDTARPSWSAVLPSGTEGLEVGQGDFSPDAVLRRGDSAMVVAAIAPGEKQLALEYHLPVRRPTLAVPFAQAVATVNLLVEESDAEVSGFPEAAADTQVVEGRTFRRWHGSVPAGTVIRVSFSGERRSERRILAALVGAVALALVVAAWRYRTLAAVLLVAAAGCGGEAGGSRAIRLVDDAGDTVALRAPARRVVSLIPASTELLFAIGAGETVVGRTAWCDYPPAAASVTNVGDGINPNVETVLAQRPDLVVLYRSAQHGAAVQRLRQLGVVPVQLRTDLLSDVGRVARILGRLTGHEAEADSLAGAFDSSLAGATVRAAAARPRVLLLVWEQPPMTVGTGSFLSELVERAGGANLFADVSRSAAPVSIEAVAARDPDLVLLTTEGPAAFATRPEWRAVRAVRERRFVRVGGSAFSHPGPRSPGAIAELARRLREARLREARLREAGG